MAEPEPEPKQNEIATAIERSLGTEPIEQTELAVESPKDDSLEIEPETDKILRNDELQPIETESGQNEKLTKEDSIAIIKKFSNCTNQQLINFLNNNNYPTLSGQGIWSSAKISQARKKIR